MYNSFWFKNFEIPRLYIYIIYIYQDFFLLNLSLQSILDLHLEYPGGPSPGGLWAGSAQPADTWGGG